MESTWRGAPPGDISTMTNRLTPCLGVWETCNSLSGSSSKLEFFSWPYKLVELMLPGYGGLAGCSSMPHQCPGS